MTPAEAPRHRLLLLSVSLVALAAAVWWMSQPYSCPSSQTLPRYRPVQVRAVTPAGTGYAVDLSVLGRKNLIMRPDLTMYVGASEGLAISLGADGQHYLRPLSMNLMDSALRELGAELLRVQIDSVRGNAFIASIHLRQGGRSIVLDARASDAVALALIRHVPILASDNVIR